MDGPFYKKWWFWVLTALVAVSLPFSVRYAIHGEPEGPSQAQQEPADPEPEASEPAPETPEEPGPESQAMTYVLNTNTLRFHLPGCESVTDMKQENRQDFTGSREELIAEGYKPCGRCQP